MATSIESFQELAEKHKQPEDDGTYPGSRQTRRGVRETSVSKSEPEEDDTDPLSGEEPRMMEVRGEMREFFPIGALARALKREVQSIRVWERKNYLPEATYRSPGRKQDRLYTRRQILGLVALAEEEGLMDPSKKKRIDQTKFPERARNLFAALKKAGR